MGPEGERDGPGGFAYTLREKRGNAMDALVDRWLEGGILYGEEHKFLDILKMVGMKGVEYLDPNHEAPAVIPVYLSVKNPLETTAIPPKVMQALEAAARRQGPPKDPDSRNQWNKNAKRAEEWLNDVKEGLKDPELSYAFTVIPDWVTRTLKRLGYDGIRDVGGKGGGAKHAVWIPFEPTQVKSIHNRGSFDPKSPNIMQQKVKGDARTGELDLSGDARKPAKREKPATIADWVAQIEADPYTARRGESQADRLNRIRRVPGEPDDAYLRRLYGDRYDAVMADPEERRYAINKAGRLADFTDKKVSIGDGAFHEALRRANFNILPTDFGPQPKGVETLYLSHQTGAVGGGRIPYTVVVLHPGAEPPTRHPDVVYVREGEPIIDAVSRLQEHYAQTVTRPNAQGRYMLQVASKTRR